MVAKEQIVINNTETSELVKNDHVRIFINCFKYLHLLH